MTKEERIKLIRHLKYNRSIGADYMITDKDANEIIKALEQEAILDKIRAEIEEKYGNCNICEWFENYDYEENDISEYRPIGNIADILQIIDKYRDRAESEGEE